MPEQADTLHGNGQTIRGAAEALMQMNPRKLGEDASDVPTEDVDMAEEEARDEPTLLEADEDADDFDDEELDELEADSDEDAEADDTDEEVWTVKADGEEHELTTEELIQKASAGINYLRKSSELGQQRKEFEQQREQEMQELREERQLYSQLLPALQNQIQAEREQIESLRETDPAEYLIRSRELDNREQNILAEQQRVQSAQAEDYQRKLKAHLEAEHAALLEKVPEWQDRQKFQKDMEDLTVKAQQHYGITPDQVQGIQNHQELLILRDAIRHRDTQAKVQDLKPKAKRRPAKPSSTGAQRTAKARKAKKLHQRLRKSGSVKDAAALLASRTG